MKKLQWICLAALFVFSLIVIFQNLASTEVRLLFITFQLPQAALLLITLGIGYVLGLSTTTIWRVALWRAKTKRAKLSPIDPVDPQIPPNSV